MSDPTRRFSNRVENYIRYRPGYPAAIIPALARECGLTPSTVVADLGSGTGLLTQLFLDNGNRVFAIEPNREMRAAAERLLAGQPRFNSVDASAEATGLPEQSIDLIVAGQAFHWFDRSRCRAEFRRILRPPGWIALIWNDRKTSGTPFLIDYEQFLRRCANDYAAVDHKQIDQKVLSEFFGTTPARLSFENSQQFDFEGLRGRVLSSSYMPESGQPGHQEMLRALAELFEQHQTAGTVRLEYETVVFLGRLT